MFTSSYRSKEKIQRPYRSLLNQTYPNWEWVIVDDSGDDGETYKNDLLSLKDPACADISRIPAMAILGRSKGMPQVFVQGKS
ncbi:glycosyltransferase family A protein [Paenibacillus larvae]|nr:glycosyltransferase family A protein [Paenibacillus larvae]MDT2260330.1 glycosyltransferase family A protein [Paenibacillus larvae]